MIREVKPKSARTARVLAKRAPLQNENPKRVLFLRSTSSSSLGNSIVADLFALKRPLAVRFTKKNTIHPFEDASSLEFFSEKNDTSLICFASHNKKRPHCLTFVRCFGGKVLDMLEFSVAQDTARTLAQFGGSKCRVGVKPLISFSGLPFEEGSSGERDYSKFLSAKSILLDFFRGEEAKEVDVEGLQLMISFVANEDDTSKMQATGSISMRVWRISTRKSGLKLPRVELEEMGPRIDLGIGRARVADESMEKEALRRGHTNEAKSKKNIEIDPMGDRTGRIHLGRQNLNEMQTRKMKGLKRGRVDSMQDNAEEDELINERDEFDEGDDNLKSGASDFDMDDMVEEEVGIKRQRVI